MEKSDALNTLDQVFHHGDEMGDSGWKMVVDLALWNKGREAIEALIGGEEELEMDRDETPEETIHNLRTIYAEKQDEIERLKKDLFDAKESAGEWRMKYKTEAAHTKYLQERVAELAAHMAAVIKDAKCK